MVWFPNLQELVEAGVHLHSYLQVSHCAFLLVGCYLQYSNFCFTMKLYSFVFKSYRLSQLPLLPSFSWWKKECRLQIFVKKIGNASLEHWAFLYVEILRYVKQVCCTIMIILVDVSEEQVETVIGEVKQQGFDCWKTVIGGPGVGLHFGEPNSDFTIPLALQSRAKMCNIL